MGMRESEMDHGARKRLNLVLFYILWTAGYVCVDTADQSPHESGEINILICTLVYCFFEKKKIYMFQFEMRLPSC